MTPPGWEHETQWKSRKVGNLDATLGYARLYDRTLAEDYYAAMEQVENRLEAKPPKLETMPIVAGSLTAPRSAVYSCLETPIHLVALHSLLPVVLMTIAIRPLHPLIRFAAPVHLPPKIARCQNRQNNGNEQENWESGEKPPVVYQEGCIAS
jgi:hypothetical protein